jgi:[ribosomal protein S5]-alanine N-acetyltransferase
VIPNPGSTVVIREHTYDDAEAVLGYASDPRVSRYVPWEAYDDIAAARVFIARCVAASVEYPRRVWEMAVILAPSGELIGAARLGIDSVTHRRASIGYVLRRDAWGSGYGTEIATALIAFAFETLGMRRVEATTHPDNPASGRVLVKSGMNLEGRLRDHMFAKGAWRDSLLYAITLPDWMEMHPGTLTER